MFSTLDSNAFTTYAVHSKMPFMNVGRQKARRWSQIVTTGKGVIYEDQDIHTEYFLSACRAD
jgi:hypothetical protein